MTRFVLSLLLAGQVAAAGGLFAATDAEVQSMRGLSSLRVVAETLGEGVTKLGLSHRWLQTIVEAHLQQQYHIKLSDDSPVFVYIKCPVVGPYKGVIAYHLSVQVRQMVTLNRDPNLQLITVTWEEEGTYMTTEHKFTQSVQDQLEELLDRLGYDFLKANAK